MPTLEVKAAVGEGAVADYTGGYTNEQVTYKFTSVSTAPFLRFEVYRNNELVETLTPAATKSEDKYTAAAAYPLPKIDTDDASYKIIAYTTNKEGGTEEFNSAAVDNLIYNYDNTAPQFGTISYTRVNTGTSAFIARVLSFGLFFNEEVLVTVPVNNEGSGGASGSARSGFGISW